MGNDLISAAGLIRIIDESRQNALKKVNEELITMYWKVGEFLSKESEQAAFGDAYIDGIANEIQEAFNNERLYGAKPQTVNCTNAWINTKVLENIQTPVQQRGTDPNCFYNCFSLI